MTIAFRRKSYFWQKQTNRKMFLVKVKKTEFRLKPEKSHARIFICFVKKLIVLVTKIAKNIDLIHGNLCRKVSIVEHCTDWLSTEGMKCILICSFLADETTDIYANNIFMPAIFLASYHACAIINSETSHTVI